MPVGWAIAGASLLGGMMQADAMDSASAAQSSSDAARLAEEKRVREQLRQDTEAQRAIADQAFNDYKAGLIDYATAQQKAAQAYQAIQQQVGQSQLSDTSKAMEMAKFTPYSIRTGGGQTFFDTATGQAGYNLSPELQAMQQSAYGGAGQALQNIATTPQAAAEQYMAQQQGLLSPQRQAEDIALRQQQLQRGRIGLGISSEAAGAGSGGMLNPEQFSRDRARALADAQIAANATQAGQQQALSQAQLAQGLYNIGAAPDTTGLGMLTTGANLGNVAAQQGLTQANLYSGGMSDYYNSLLGAGQTAQQAALFNPQAVNAGLQEGYNRQQTYLGALQGNTLPYQAMSTPSAQVPGSAYTQAALGSGLMSAGVNSLNKYMNQAYSSPYGANFGTAWQYGTNPGSQQTAMLAEQMRGF